MKPAIVELQHGSYKILGPSHLIAWIQLLQNAQCSPDDKRHMYQEEIKNWCVTCSITGEQVSLFDLHYWNVETGAIYKSPQIMPLHDRY